MEVSYVLPVLIYLFTFLLNSDIIVLIFMNHRLHSMMYFLLRHLSFMDICFHYSLDNSYVVGIWDSFILHMLRCSGFLFCLCSLAQLIAISWPSWQITIMWLCSDFCFMSPSSCRRPFQALWLGLMFLAF